MGPIDYRIDVQTPFQAALQGYQAGAGIRDDQFKQQQQQAALAQQQQMQQDIAAVTANPNAGARDYAALTLKYPALKDQFKQAWDMSGKDQQAGKLDLASRAYAALSTGRPDVAEQLMRDRAAAMRNSGAPEQDVKAQEMWADLIKASPEQARHIGGLMLSSVMDPDKFASTFGTLGDQGRSADKAPAEVSKAQADARKATAEATTSEVAAGNAPTKTALDNQLAVEDVETKRLKRDLDRLDAQIKTANSETDRGRLTLERDKLNAELQQKQQDKAQAAQDGMDALTQGLQTIESIRKSAGLDSNFAGLGGVGSATGKLAGMIPGTDRKDLEGLVTTLKSQQFLAGIKQMTGMGALSNAEGDKISAAVASLDLDQSPGAFKNALGVIEANLRKAQAKTVAGGKLPTTGGAVVLQSPKYGVVTEGQINALLKQYPGSTREQVMQFLQAQGGR